MIGTVKAGRSADVAAMAPAGADEIHIPGGIQAVAIGPEANAPVEGFLGHAEQANIGVRRYNGRNIPHAEAAE